jgi:tripartite-type tricarboxylate transporter receptor subunit TctC
MKLSLSLATSGILFSLCIGTASAQSYPSKPIKLIIPFAPGGFTDVVARIVGQKLGAALGQPFVIENKVGAGSTLGTDFVAKSAPDGYTLVMVSSNHVIGPYLYKDLPYDPVKSFAPIAKLADSPYVLFVNSQVPARNVAEFIALAKAKPNTIHYASSGNGSTQHLMASLFTSLTNTELVHVPYRGSAVAMQDLVAGFVESSFAGVTNGLGHVRTGKLRALAVTSAKRSAQLPDVPSLQESGVAGYDASVWLALLAPAGTPKEIVNRLNAEVAKILVLPDTKKAFESAGVEPSPSGSEELKEYLVQESERWGKVVKDTHVKID